MRPWRCWFRHVWETRQESVTVYSGAEIVIAWKQCERCAASELLHILS